MKNRKKRKEEWWVYYRNNAECGEDHVVVLPSVGKLLRWIAKYANRCCQVEIVLKEG